MNSPSSAHDFFEDILGVKQPNNFLIKTKVEYNDGSYSVHFRQFYSNIKVEGGIYILYFRNGGITNANGHFVNIKDLNTSPMLTPEQACKSYINFLNLEDSKLPDYYHDTVIIEIEEVSGKDTIYTAKLSYKIDLLNTPENKGEIGYIDTQTGEVLKTMKNYTYSSANAVFHTLYSGTRGAKTQKYNNIYNLCDSSRDAVIHTWDINNTIYEDYSSNRIEFTDDNNDWTLYEHEANYDQMAQDVHWGLQEIYDYFYEEHNGFSSFDNNDADIEAYIHALFYLAHPKDNAAHAIVQGHEALFFGDGEFYYHPVASLDIVAHEYAHAITHNNTGLDDTMLIHQAMNEGLSDIWGVVIENAVDPNDPDKDCWKIGEEVINIPTKDCIRNIKDPESSSAKTQIADTYGDNIYNNGGIYEKSGIMSHWFYLLAEGGTGTNDNNDDYTVYGLGMDNTAKIVFKGHIDGFGSVDSYTEARVAMIDASEYIFSDLESMQVANAWYAVGVGSEPSQIGITGSTSIYPYGIKFTLDNLPSGCTVTWSCSDNISLSNVHSNPVVASSNGSDEGWIKATVSSEYTDIELDKFYVTVYSSNPYITGSSLVCSSGSTFGLSAACSYDNIVWNVGSNLNITSGQGTSSCTIAATGIGSSDINVTLYVNGNGTDLSEKDVWAGKPIFNSINGPSQGYTGIPYTFQANPYRNPLSQSEYEWMVVPPYYYFVHYYYDLVTIVFNEPYDYYQVLGRAVNSCGPTYWRVKNVVIYSGFYFSISPNPASDFITVTIFEPASDEITTEQEILSDYKVSIFDSKGIYYYSGIKSESSFTLPVRNLRDGNYIINISKGKKTKSLQLIIKH